MLQPDLESHHPRFRPSTTSKLPLPSLTHTHTHIHPEWEQKDKDHCNANEQYFQSNHAEDRIIPLTNNITAVATEAFMAFKAFSFARAMRSTYGLRIRILLYSIGGLLVLGWIANAGMALGVPLWAITHPSLYVSLLGHLTCGIRRCVMVLMVQRGHDDE